MLILIVSAAFLALLLLYSIIRSEAILPDPALGTGWRDGNVLSRQASIVDHVHDREYQPGNLIAQADTLRMTVREGVGTGDDVVKAVRRSLAYANLLDDLADRRHVECRLERERLAYAQETRPVRAVCRVAGALT